MVTFTLTDRMGSRSILPIKVSVTTDTMLNFDDDFDGHGDGDVTCKQSLLAHTHSKASFTRTVNVTVFRTV